MENLRSTRLLSVAAVLGFCATAWGQTAVLWLDPPEAILNAGDSVTFEVFIDDVQEMLRAYQIQIEIGVVTGTLGTPCPPPDPPQDNPAFGWCHFDLLIDTNHPDFVFQDPGLGTFFPTINPALLRLEEALLDPNAGVIVTEPRYLGTYEFQAPLDALGEFTLDFDETDTFLRRSGGGIDPIPILGTTGATITVTEVSPCDNCVDHSCVITDGVTPFSTNLGTVDGPTPPPSCDGGTVFGPDIWFEYTATCTGPLVISTCDDADFDTRLAVYGGGSSCACPQGNGTLVACNDDAAGCSGFTSEVVLSVTQGQCYTIRLGSPSAQETGTGNLTVVCMANDTCDTAEEVSVPSTVVGSTRNADIDSGVPSCGPTPDSPGVWYTMWSTGNRRMTASLCGGASFDTRLTVYGGFFCGSMSCVADVDDTCGSQEEVSWCTLPGRRYWILVHGAGGESGTFTLDVSVDDCNDGVACTTDSCDFDTDTCLNEQIICPGTDACTEVPCDPVTGDCLPPVPIDCDDGNDCTDDDCDEISGCFYTNNSDPCTDNDACTTGDACSAGVCAGAPIDCEEFPPNLCTDDSCDSAIGCLLLPVDCDDGDPCTTDFCTDTTFGCDHGSSPAGIPCDDGDLCTINDTCDGSGNCSAGAPLVCNDGEPCTEDDCIPATGCAYPPTDCEDGDPCTVDTCDPGIGCDHEPNIGGDCDDGNPCTTGETCDAGANCSGGGPTDCNDLNECTNDSCDPLTGCVNVDNYDVDNECCDPGTGETLPIEDENPCTFGQCNPATGQVTQIPVPDGPDPGCFDDLDCTLDECLSGLCANTDINTIPCGDDTDCPGELACAVGAGHCVCLEAPSLAIVVEPGSLPVDTCFAIGETVTVRIEMGFSPQPIVSGQFFLEYDPTTLSFVDMVAGGTVDPGSPFNAELGQVVNPVAGTIMYGVSVPPGGSGTAEPALMAVMTFQAEAECTAFVGFQPGGRTLLFDENLNDYEPIIDEPQVLLSTNASPPVLTACPTDVATNPDPGFLTAVVTWTSPTATDSCDGAVPVSCNPPSGSAFDPGTTIVTCSAVNSCGVGASCTFDVTVIPSTLTVDVELAPIIMPGPIVRCITFEVHDCVAGIQVAVPYDVTFTSGQALSVVVPVPTGTWDCVTARDTLHTLRSTADDLTTADGIDYMATFTGAWSLGGDQLIGGDLNDDGWVDTMDYAIFLSQYLQPLAPNTPCPSTGPHADINGDGVVSVADLGHIQLFMFQQDEPNCCGLGGSTGLGPIKEISMPELYARGLRRLQFGDMNKNGKLDPSDIATFIEVYGAAEDKVGAMSTPRAWPR